MSLFNFKKKAKTEPSTEQSTENETSAAKAPNTEISHFVALALEQEREGNVLLGKRTSSKDGKTEELFFIAFREEQINNFLGEWYETLAAVRKPNSRLSQNGSLYDTWMAQKYEQFNIPRS